MLTWQHSKGPCGMSTHELTAVNGLILYMVIQRGDGTVYTVSDGGEVVELGSDLSTAKRLSLLSVRSTLYVQLAAVQSLLASGG
jgi:hypothetical protein